jgi:uncharacterized protein YjiS (DUF1127 family)
MSNVSHDKPDKSNGYLLQGLPDRVFAPLKLISDVFHLYKVPHRFQEEWLRYTMIKNLDRLNDDYLDDIGIKRKDIRPIVNAIIKCVRNRRLGSQRYPIFTLTGMVKAGVLPGWPMAEHKLESRCNVRKGS